MPKARSIFLAGLLAGSAVITWGSVSYLTDRGLHPFVLDKEPLPFRSLWLGALYIHIAAASWSLPACVLLSSRRVLARAPRLHRWLGRTTSLVLLLGLCPSGFVLSSTAQGGGARLARLRDLGPHRLRGDGASGTRCARSRLRNAHALHGTRARPAECCSDIARSALCVRAATDRRRARLSRRALGARDPERAVRRATRDSKDDVSDLEVP